MPPEVAPPPLDISIQPPLAKENKGLPSPKYKPRPLPQRHTDHIPGNALGVLTHAITGAVRAYVQALLGRGGLTFLLKLLAVLRGRATFLGALKSSFGAPETRRFACTFGLFSFLWKGSNNGLRLLRDGRADRWNGAISGAIAGLAILVESPENRSAFVQQLAVRAAQAGYNGLKDRRVIHFPMGDTFIFTLSCAQILYAYLMRPSSLSPDFYRFMIATARVPEPILKYNAAFVRGDPSPGHIANVAAVFDISRRFHATSANLQRNVHFITSPIYVSPNSIPCSIIHPAFDSCVAADTERWFRVFHQILPVQVTVNLVPTLLFRLQKLRADPVAVGKRLAKDSLRSAAFLSSFVTVYQAFMCILRSGQGVRDSKFYYWLGGALSGLTILMETKGRRSELALYVLPKAIEAWLRIMIDKQSLPHFPHFNTLLSSLSMAVIMSFYQHEPECISPWFRGTMRQVLGRN